MKQYDSVLPEKKIFDKIYACNLLSGLKIKFSLLILPKIP